MRHKVLQCTEDNDDVQNPKEIRQIPSDIRPNIRTFRVEVLFWGLRNLRKVHFLAIKKPKITVELSNEILECETITSTNQCLNFPSTIKFMDVVNDSTKTNIL